MQSARIIEIIDDDGQDQHNESLQDVLKRVTPSLRIPTAFTNDDWAVQPSGRAMIAWRNSALNHLEALKSVVEIEDASTFSDADLLSSIIALVVPFTGPGPWAKEESRITSQELLCRLPEPPLVVFRSVLLSHIKPLFDKCIAHPMINAETGRTLPRPAGGEDAIYPMEHQPWKDQPGIDDLLMWCVTSLHENDWEASWPLVIPPIMTMLDDHEMRNRLSGVTVVQALVNAVPTMLLRHTGVGELIEKSLTNSLLQLHDPLSPTLFRLASRTHLTLGTKLTSPRSQAHYEKCFALLGDYVIGSAWTYGYREPALLQASYDVVAQITATVGVAVVRYVKPLVTQLCYSLVPQPEVRIEWALQLAAVKALRSIVAACGGRMEAYRKELVASVAKCWTQILDEGAEAFGSERVKEALVGLMEDLSRACPIAVECEYKRLVQLDQVVFKPLVAPTVTT